MNNKGKVFDPTRALEKYRESYALSRSRKAKVLTFLFVLLLLPIGWFWFQNHLWWKGIPFLWLMGRYLILKKTHTPCPKLPLVAELTTL